MGSNTHTHIHTDSNIMVCNQSKSHYHSCHPFPSLFIHLCTHRCSPSLTHTHTHTHDTHTIHTYIYTRVHTHTATHTRTTQTHPHTTRNSWAISLTDPPQQEGCEPQFWELMNMIICPPLWSLLTTDRGQPSLSSPFLSLSLPLSLSLHLCVHSHHYCHLEGWKKKPLNVQNSVVFHHKLINAYIRTHVGSSNSLITTIQLTLHFIRLDFWVWIWPKILLVIYSSRFVLADNIRASWSLA